MVYLIKILEQEKQTVYFFKVVNSYLDNWMLQQGGLKV